MTNNSSDLHSYKTEEKGKPASESYPRVLIMHTTSINVADAQAYSYSLREWFKEWPKEHLAQVYSGHEGREQFCGANYCLSTADRWFGSLFFSLKRSEAIAREVTPCVAVNEVVDRSAKSPRRIIQRALKKLLFDTGLYELIFRPRLSVAMRAFVTRFRPDVIYAQGYTLTFCWLPMMLTRAFGVPIVFQTGDDWPRSLYAHTPAAGFVRPVVNQAARRLICSAAARLANGDEMAEEYGRRYERDFAPMMMCDDSLRIVSAAPQRIHDQRTFSILVSGGFWRSRWELLVDLDKACAVLAGRGLVTRVAAFVSMVSPDGLAALKQCNNVDLMPPVAHEDFPRYLRGADLLALVESFDKKDVEYARLSVSTKAHLYMMSQRPVMVYGASATGIVKYAKRYGWAHVLTERNVEGLADVLESLARDRVVTDELVRRGNEVVCRFHEGETIRARFRAAICRAATVRSDRANALIS
jgi:glycosyltransferase involved in cell wall biosynthesis